MSEPNGNGDDWWELLTALCSASFLVACAVAAVWFDPFWRI